MKKLASTLIAAAALACSSIASAAVVNFAIGGTYSQGSGQSDIPSPSISLGGAGAFTLDPGSSADYFDFLMASTGTFSTTVLFDGYWILQSYGAGDVIGAGSYGDHGSGLWSSILVDGQAPGVWDTSHNGYIGFHNAAGNYGWIEYGYTRSAGVSTMQFFGGAYESEANVSIAVPGAAEVPEPGSLALLGLGLVGLAASRKRKQA